LIPPIHYIFYNIIVIILYSRIYNGCGTRDGVVGGDLARAYNTLSFVCVRERIKRKKILDETHVYGLRQGATRKRRADTTLLSSSRRVVVGVFVSGGVARVSERKGRLSDAADAVRLQHALVGHAAPPAHASVAAPTAADAAEDRHNNNRQYAAAGRARTRFPTPAATRFVADDNVDAAAATVSSAFNGDFPADRPAVVAASQTSPVTTAPPLVVYATDGDVARARVFLAARGDDINLGMIILDDDDIILFLLH